MGKRMHYIVFSIAFVFAFLIAIVVSLTLIGPYIGGYATAVSGIYSCCDWTTNCKLEELDLACPLILGKNHSEPVTVSITNPYNTEEVYATHIGAMVLEQGKYHVDDVCYERIVISPGQTESLTCDLHPKRVGGKITWIRVTAMLPNRYCGGSPTVCGVQAYYWLYCLLPFVVAAPFAWWLIKIRKGDQPG
jgi:hypothetical protein